MQLNQKTNIKLKDPRNKSYFLFIVFGFFVVIFFIIASYFALSKSFFNTPSQRTIPLENPDGPGLSDQTTVQEEAVLERSSLVQQLVNKTPYKGADFSFYYSYDKNEFILFINPANLSAGNLEFNNFLKENGVEDQAWINNLNTVSAEPNPEP